MSTPDLATTPVMPPPAGQTSDFSGGSYLQHTIIVVYSVTFALATVVLLLRLYTRAVIVRGLGLDEPIIILSWALSLAFFIFMVLSMPAGFGKHLWDVSVVQLQGYLNLLLVLALTYIWPPSLTKLAIVVLYHRINPGKGFRMACWATGFAVFSYTVVFTALFAGPCNPGKTGSGVCLNNIAIAQAVLNIISDIVLIVLPVPMIHSLNMPFRQKLIVGSILALGSGATIASIGRLSYVKAMQNNPDVTWTQASAAVWSSVEINLGIICNCTALLKPFARRHLGWISGGSSGDVSGPSGYGNAGSGARFAGKSGSKSGGGADGWRPDPVKHSYQLHSVDKSGVLDSEGRQGVVRVDEYSVQFDNKGSKAPSEDGSSTKNILIDDPKRRRNGGY